MRLSKEQQQFTLDIARLVLFAESQCLYLTYGHAWRSPEEQKRLHDAGKSQVLESKHQSRLAVDFNFFKEDGSLTYNGKMLKYWVISGKALTQRTDGVVIGIRMI